MYVHDAQDIFVHVSSFGGRGVLKPGAVIPPPNGITAPGESVYYKPPERNPRNDKLMSAKVIGPSARVCGTHHTVSCSIVVGGYQFISELPFLPQPKRGWILDPPTTSGPPTTLCIGSASRGIGQSKPKVDPPTTLTPLPRVPILE